MVTNCCGVQLNPTPDHMSLSSIQKPSRSGEVLQQDDVVEDVVVLVVEVVAVEEVVRDELVEEVVDVGAEVVVVVVFVVDADELVQVAPEQLDVVVDPVLPVVVPPPPP